MSGWATLVVFAVLLAVAVLGGRYGADSRPGVDRAPNGWWQHRS